MSVGRIIEISAMSEKSFDDAVREGIARAEKTLRHIKGAWIKDMRVDVQDGNVIGYQVNMQITFLMDDSL
ncbi:MAG: dodecin domain-containing protein [Chloroflexaceae bacterium]|nr:dodecin domain-containing protein [Chloroflexaceae bacterium]